jgi:dTDP-4-amino-4,6-dideoxygalactose transaminase
MIVNFTNINKLFIKKKDIINKISKNIDTNQFIGGKQLETFKNQFKNFLGCKYVIPVANGTDALEIALKSLNLPEGSEVIVPANSWISSASCVIQNNLKLVFCDVDLCDYSISIHDLNKKITKKTKCIIPVHLYGNPANMIEIIKLAKKKKIKVIEDCSQAHGSSISEKFVGTFGDLGTYSFFPSKNIGALGDAGCIVTNNYKLNEFCQRYANHGALKKYDHKFVGRNSRLDVINATVLIEKIKNYKKVMSKRLQLSKIYDEKFKNNKNIITFKYKKKYCYSFHQYVIRVSPKNRNRLKNYLLKKKIETMIHYSYMLNELKFFKYKKKLKNAHCLGDKILSLPISEEHSKKEVNYVADQVNLFFQRG